MGKAREEKTEGEGKNNKLLIRKSMQGKEKRKGDGKKEEREQK